MAKHTKSILKGALDTLASATKSTWNRTSAVPKVHRTSPIRSDSEPRKPSASLLQKALESPILLSQFQRWSRKPYPQEIDLPKRTSTMSGLDTNIFAQMLASPTRMEKHSSAVLPRDLMIRLGFVTNSDSKDGDKKPHMLTALWHGEQSVQGKKGYIALSNRAFQQSQKQVAKLVSRINMDGFRKDLLSPGSVKWNDIDYSQMMIKEIETLLVRLCGKDSVAKPDRSKPHYRLVLRLEENSPAVCLPSKSQAVESKTIAEFNISKLIGPRTAEKWTEILKTTAVIVNAQDSDKQNIGMQIVNLLWRYSLFMH